MSCFEFRFIDLLTFANIQCPNERDIINSLADRHCTKFPEAYTKIDGINLKKN